MKTRLQQLLIKSHQALEKNDTEGSWLPVAEALNCDMDNPEALYLAGIFMRRKGHSGIAANLFRRSVAMNPKPINSWMYFAACLHDIHAYPEAMEVWEYIKQQAPEDCSLWRNIAATLVQTGKHAESLSAVEKCIKFGKGNPPESIYAIRALANLGLARWREGFRDYRYLYGDTIQVRQYLYKSDVEPAPVWNGEKGKIVIVQGDQGVGDEIMFSSVLPDMLKDCKRVIYDCHPKMEMVFKRSFPGAIVVGTRKKAVVDWLDELEAEWPEVRSIHISSIGRYYRTKDKDFPRQPYLKPNDALREKWRNVLADYPRPLVGLAWVGGNVMTMRELRSVHLEAWRPLVKRGGTFVDLCYHDSKAEVEEFNQKNPEETVLHLEVDQTDYDDTLALIAELDLIASVTTSVVHASGAIGKRCLVLANKWIEWRMAPSRYNGMVWYAPNTIKLYRQLEQEADFSHQIAEIAKDYERDFADILGSRSEATTGLHGLPELDHQESIPPGVDHTPDSRTTTYF